MRLTFSVTEVPRIAWVICVSPANTSGEFGSETNLIGALLSALRISAASMQLFSRATQVTAR